MGRSTTAGAEALAQGMEQNSWLEELDLSKNHIKMLGAEPWWLGEEPPLIDDWNNLMGILKHESDQNMKIFIDNL